MANYSLDDALKGYRWLAHKGFTELLAAHPDYRPGKENYEWNKAHNAFPRVEYVTDEKGLTKFIMRYSSTHIVCYCANPRQQEYRNERGYPRAAREEEITIAQSMFADLDLEAKTITEAHHAAAEKFLGEADDYFQDLGLAKPVRAFSGRGYHLLFAYPGIMVAEHPDIAARQQKFIDDFKDSYHKELANLEARVDATHDLRRMVKMYGTAKPQVGIVSRFLGGERQEDEALATYLLSMNLENGSAVADGAKPSFGAALVYIKNELPPIFLTLLHKDEKLRQLWEGTGKMEGDTSGSGYDFSLARKLLACGITDVSDIATILALRPGGSCKASGKGEEYLRRTIAKALAS
jgi:hypothetical protein